MYLAKRKISGPILKAAGHNYGLCLDERWKRCRGAPLFEQQFKVRAVCLDSFFKQRAVQVCEHNTWHVKLCTLQILLGYKRNNYVG